MPARKLTRSLSMPLSRLLVPLPEYAGAAAPSYTYAVFNAADMAAAYVLSDGDLRIRHVSDGGSWRLGRMTIGKATGEWQAHIAVTDVGGGNIIIGVSKAAASVNSFLGADANGWGYHASGQKVNGGNLTAYGTAYGLNSVITIRYNADTGDLEFKNGGTSQGVIATGLTGEVSLTWSSYNLNCEGLGETGATGVAFPFPDINQGWFDV